jgi:GH15 family glucan-1,4-alpha-glucosidase
VLSFSRHLELDGREEGWRVQCSLLDFLESKWPEPDDGIWEVRGPRRHFTHSKMMAWVAFDRAVRDAEDYGLPGPVDRWREHRQRIHEEVCAKAFDAERNTFVQYYGATELDASLLMMPLVGFLPVSDPRVQGTIAGIEKELLRDGFVRRYTHAQEVDGLPPGEGAFFLCTYWLADVYAMAGRTDEARAIFERLLAMRNDVGLLSEEYDVRTGRLVGNFPQAFSHVGLVNTALNLTRGFPSPRRRGSRPPKRKPRKRAARSRR